MMKYPIKFQARADASFGIQAHWQANCGQNMTKCSIPPEFEGPGGAFSPEDFFALALTNCFLGTFKVYAEKSKANFENIYAHSELSLDLDERGCPMMKSFDLNILIKGAASRERLEVLAQKAFQSGFILNSVKTKITLKIEFE